MRRQARRIRRSGMQPMMVITGDDQLPETIGVLSAAGYGGTAPNSPRSASPGHPGRSLLAARRPPAMGGACVLVLPRWPLSAGWSFGGRCGLPTLIERLYVAVTYWPRRRMG